MTSLLQQYLEQLYPGQSAELLAEIGEICLDKKQELKLDLPNKELGSDVDSQLGCEKNTQNYGPFDQSDCLLISYADQIEGHAEQTSLGALKSFYEAELTECFSGVHLLPFYPYTSDGGFSVSSYTEVDSSYGSWRDVEAFECELMFDAVFNHTSSEHTWFVKFLEGSPEYSNFFHVFGARPEPETELHKQLQQVVRPRSTDLLTEFSRMGEATFVWSTFSADQIDVNFAEPKVFIEFVKVLKLYIEKGSRYLRIDAVPFFWKELGTSCVHHEKTHLLVKAFREVCSTIDPTTILVTESNVPHQENVSYLGSGDDEVHMVYNFSLAPLILHALVEGTATHLKDWSSNLEPLPGHTSFFNFTATHDGIGVRPLEGILTDDQVLRLAERMQELGGQVNFRSVGEAQKPYELNITWGSALYEEDSELHIQKILCSYAMSFVFPGVVGFYFHNLFATPNWQEGFEKTNHRRDLNRRKFTTSEVDSLLNEAGIHREVFMRTKALLKSRREHIVFHPQAELKTMDSPDELWVVEKSIGSKKARFIFNVSDKQQTFEGQTLSPYSFEWPFDLSSV